MSDSIDYQVLSQQQFLHDQGYYHGPLDGIRNLEGDVAFRSWRADSQLMEKAKAHYHRLLDLIREAKEDGVFLEKPNLTAAYAGFAGCLKPMFAEALLESHLFEALHEDDAEEGEL